MSLCTGLVDSKRGYVCPVILPAIVLKKFSFPITWSTTESLRYAWLQYDSQFCLKIAANHSMRRSVTDPELTAIWLSADATKAKQPCFSCGSSDHLAPHCPLKASVPAPGLCYTVYNNFGHSAHDCTLLLCESVPRTTTQPHTNHSKANDDNICRIYNKRAFCLQGANSQHLYICSACRGGHPRHACPKQVQ